MTELSKGFPKGIEYKIVYNPTEFIQRSVDELIKTIFEAVVLVVIVVLVFLQTWRATIIPLVAIPVSLIGTFFVMSLVWLLDQQPDPVRARARGWHRGRRRDCRRRKRRAQNRARLQPQGRRLFHDERGRRSPDLHRFGVVRGLHPHGVPAGNRRPVLPPIRAHHRGRDRPIRLQLADAEPSTLRDCAPIARGEGARSRASTSRFSRTGSSRASMPFSVCWSGITQRWCAGWSA